MAIEVYVLSDGVLYETRNKSTVDERGEPLAV